MCQQLLAQEMVVPLRDNPFVQQKNAHYNSKKTRASLPFIDDFSYNASTPDTTLWIERQVFINNTMGVNAPTKGVATFDGLDATGRPYRPNDFGAVGFGDSLTCTPIDLSSNNTSDGIVLSFYVQAMGNGFPPEQRDSMYVFFRNSSNKWIEQYRRRGSFVHPFIQIFLPVDDPQYLHDSFQFRFVNFTSLNLNDDVWNIDYVKLDAGRSIDDTTLNDIAFTEQPTSILNTLTAMPFRQFAPADLSAQQDVTLRNIYDVTNSFVLHHNAIEVNTNTNLSNTTQTAFSMSPKSTTTRSVPSYNIGLSGAGPFVVRDTYFIDAINGTDRKSNDTIITETVFDNYFAYDDGTAEQAYFLNPALNQPSKTAIRFDLRQADTVYGVSVYFAAQVPSAAGKFLSVGLYDSLGNTSANDVILKQQDLYTVQYPSQRGDFSFYAFDQPVAVGPGTYYIGLSQPANFQSDSVYYGLDKNTNNNIQKFSFNVNGFWVNSAVQGTVMMRPMVGRRFTSTAVNSIEKISNTILYPNPASNIIYIESEEIWSAYQITNIAGQAVQKGKIQRNKINIDALPSGQYLITLNNKNKKETHTVWKQ